MYLEHENLNQSLISLARILLNEGIKRETRGKICYEINEPVLIKVSNPSDRHINIKERKGYNKYLPFAESLWILNGVNELSLPGTYTPNLYSYSDDGKHMRASYSPRIRSFSGITTDYAIDTPKERNILNGGSFGCVDQIKYVVESFKRDINSRQCVVEIADPPKDCFNQDGTLKVTKDQPCTRLLNFQVRDEKLDITVYMRSNDLVFGYACVNFTNFAIFQEIISKIIGVPVGNYYTMANNMHYYDNHENLLENIASQPLDDYPSEFGDWQYEGVFSLEKFDELIYQLYQYELGLRTKQHEELLNFNNDMIDDWAKIFFRYHTKKEVEFVNPYLNKLFLK